MSALDRWDDWEARLDPDAEPDDSSVVELEDLYDEATLEAIDGRAVAPDTHAGWRGTVVAGALATGIVTGLRDTFDPDDDRPIAEDPDLVDDQRSEPVVVRLAWGDPSASVAIVRPWLFPSSTSVSHPISTMEA